MQVVVLTGAGISADSGVPTFRDADGYWATFDWQRLATPEAFAETPSDVHAFYNARRAALPTVEPNAAHAALAELEEVLLTADGSFTLITQNVDGLHDRAGSKNVIPMHGRLTQARCTHCGAVHDWEADLSTETACPNCKTIGGMRPNVVWFGEVPFGLNSIGEAMSAATHFVAIGTSGAVYPAAGLAAEAKRRGVPTVELNLAPADNASLFDEAHYGPAAEIVPHWCNAFRKRHGLAAPSR